MKMLHVGRKAPKGWTELPGAIHLGNGTWMMWVERKLELEPPK